MTRPRLIAAALLAALVAAAAGCGGHSDKKANEEYASTVCSAVGTWETQVKEIATDFSTGISQASVADKLGKVQTATTELVNQVAEIDPPDTDEGKAAKTQIDAFTGTLTTFAAALKTSVEQIKADPSAGTIAAAALTLGPQAKTLASAGSA